MSEYERIKRSCLKRGELWEDPEFPATQTSVFYHQTPPFQFQWKRPKVIFLPNYHLVYFNINSSRIKDIPFIFRKLHDLSRSWSTFLRRFTSSKSFDLQLFHNSILPYLKVFFCSWRRSRGFTSSGCSTFSSTVSCHEIFRVSRMVGIICVQ